MNKRMNDSHTGPRSIPPIRPSGLKRDEKGDFYITTPDGKTMIRVQLPIVIEEKVPSAPRSTLHAVSPTTAPRHFAEPQYEITRELKTYTEIRWSEGRTR